MKNLKKVLRFSPNLRWEKSTATSGYTWGKPVSESNILSLIDPQVVKALNLADNDIVAERWICTDDQANPSLVQTQEELIPFFELIQQHSREILGPNHIQHFGPYLNCIMKQLDTNSQSNKGSLSVQLHPKPNHPTRPCKPEMWQGTGSVYLGWKDDITQPEIEAAIANSKLEEKMNLFQLTPDKSRLVPGGVVHAIRANSFLNEWSKAPGKDDIQKGNIKDSTVALYDRTDGKKPRPGKEDLVGSFEVMTQADSFSKTDEESTLSPAKQISKTGGHTLVQLFQTDHVEVFQLSLVQDFDLDLSMRGLPIFVSQGNIEILDENGNRLEKIKSGQECFLPHVLNRVKLVNSSPTPAIIQWWYSPLPSKL